MPQGDGFTTLLSAWSNGDQDALERLGPLIEHELRKIAGAYLRKERADHTLRPTELVSEAFVRLAGSERQAWNDRKHFFAAAARHMRQILVDHARRRSSGKRGAGERAVTFDEGLVAGERSDELVALDESLRALAEHDARKARVIELHYFGGMSQPEIAEVLELHVNTIARDLRLGEAWLTRHLEQT